MSMIVARMQKMKAGNLSGIQRHNQREFLNHSNKDIDPTRTEKNYDLVNDEPVDYKEHVGEIIDSQREGTRAIRKDAVLVDEWIITSNQEFFKDLSESDTRRFFEESVAYFSDNFGSQNVAYANVHLDETTPHMHMGIVPMKDGKLTSKTVFNRETLKRIQEEFPKHLQEKGFNIERGEENSQRKNLSIETYKEVVNSAKQEAQKEVENLKEKKAETKKEIEKVNAKNSKLKNISQKIADVFDLQKKLKEFEQKAKPTLTGNGLKVSLKDFNDLKKLVLAVAKSNIKITKDKDDLKESFDELSRDNIKLENNLERLINDKADLRKENEVLFEKMEQLKDDLSVYQDVLEHDFGVTEISEKEYNARLVLSKLDKGIQPHKKPIAEDWLEKLEKGKDTKIKRSRLEEGMKQVKAKLDKFIKLAKAKFMGLEL